MRRYVSVRAAVNSLEIQEIPGAESLASLEGRREVIDIGQEGDPPGGVSARSAHEEGGTVNWEVLNIPQEEIPEKWRTGDQSPTCSWKRRPA